MKSSRWDANGNIYLVTEESLTPDAVRAEVADTDGILEVFRTGDDWVEIAIWNPDGSRAEMSGNGTRIAALLARRADGSGRGDGARRAPRGQSAHARRHARRAGPG